MHHHGALPFVVFLKIDRPWNQELGSRSPSCGRSWYFFPNSHQSGNRDWLQVCSMLSLHTAVQESEVLRIYQKRSLGRGSPRSVHLLSRDGGGLIWAVNEIQHCPLVADMLIFRPHCPTLGTFKQLDTSLPHLLPRVLGSRSAFCRGHLPVYTNPCLASA